MRRGWCRWSVLRIIKRGESSDSSGSGDWASSHKVKGQQFNFQSGSFLGYRFGPQLTSKTQNMSGKKLEDMKLEFRKYNKK